MKTWGWWYPWQQWLPTVHHTQRCIVPASIKRKIIFFCSQSKLKERKTMIIQAFTHSAPLISFRRFCPIPFSVCASPRAHTCAHTHSHTQSRFTPCLCPQMKQYIILHTHNTHTHNTHITTHTHTTHTHTHHTTHTHTHTHRAGYLHRSGSCWRGCCAWCERTAGRPPGPPRWPGPAGSAGRCTSPFARCPHCQIDK